MTTDETPNIEPAGEDLITPQTLKNPPDPVDPRHPLNEVPEQMRSMPPIRDQNTILVLKTCGYKPVSEDILEVERGGFSKKEVHIQFEEAAYLDYIQWKLDNYEHRIEFKILRNFFASLRWWRAIIHNKHLS